MALSHYGIVVPRSGPQVLGFAAVALQAYDVISVRWQATIGPVFHSVVPYYMGLLRQCQLL